MNAQARLEALPDTDLNRAFARAYWNHPIDERNNTYWHDDDIAPEDENHEWKPLPDFCNNWSVTRKILVDSKVIVTPDGETGRTERERCRRAIVALLLANIRNEPRP